MNKPISPQTMAAMVIGVAAAAGVLESDLFYVAEKKIIALYPTLDVYSRQVVVVQALDCWHAYKSCLGQFDVHQGGQLQ